MKISVIIPVFNVEQYIVQCLQSVAGQSWTGGEIECIIVDDCGTDSSMEKVDGFLSSYEGSIDFKVIRHEKNRGLSAARNTGVEISNGDYLFFVDSDDVLGPECLALLFDKVSECPGVELVQGKRVKLIPMKCLHDNNVLDKIDYLGDNASIRKHSFELPFTAWNKLISTAYYRDNKLSFREDVIHEDELWSYYLYETLSRVAFVHETTYIHRIRPDSIMTTLDVEKEKNNWAAILLELSQVIKDPCYSKLERYYLLQLIHHYDRDEVWSPIMENICRKMKSSHDYISLIMLRHSLKNNGQFYKNWFRYTLDRSLVVRLLYAATHGIKYCLTSHTA